MLILLICDVDDIMIGLMADVLWKLKVEVCDTWFLVNVCGIDMDVMCVSFFLVGSRVGFMFMFKKCCC